VDQVANGTDKGLGWFDEYNVGMKKFNQRLNQRPAPIPFTSETFEKMKAEVERLTAERTEVIKRLQAAREMGDLSENGAYKYAKFELGSIGRQLRDLNYKLRYGVVKEKGVGDIVEFGTKVKLLGNGREVEFMLVSKHESDPAHQKLSDESPMGMAVIGKRKGDVVQVTTPAGVVEYRIVSVE